MNEARILHVCEAFGPTPDGFAVTDVLLQTLLSVARNQKRRIITSKDVTGEQATALADALTNVADDFGLRLTLYFHDDPEGETLRAFIHFLRGGGFVMRQG